MYTDNKNKLEEQIEFKLPKLSALTEAHCVVSVCQFGICFELSTNDIDL